MRTDRSQQIQLYVALSVLILALISSVFAHGVTTVPTDGNLLKEIEAPMPDYPKSVWDESPVGEVTLMFDVNEEGHVEDPCIVSSTFSGTFDLYAVKAIKGHRYEQLGGPSQHMKGVKKRFFFTLDSNPTLPVTAKYPRHALEQGAEGYVVVRFGVSKGGAVRDIEVVGSEPSGMFDLAGREAASKMKFETTQFNPDDAILHKFTFSLDSKPRIAVGAEYPSDAREQLIHGHVIVEFDINAAGEVENPEAIYSDASVLETAAIAAVSRFRFDLGKPATEVLHKIDFSLDQQYQPLSRVEPEYPEQALMDYIEGYVILQYDITETGSVENPLVLEASPPKVFDQSAINAVKQFKYLPQYVEGKPTRTERVKNRILYTLVDEDGEPHQADEEDDEDNKPGRTLADRSPEAQPQLPIPLDSHPKQLFESLEKYPPEERKRILEAFMKQRSLVRERRPTHRLSIQGNQEDGTVIIEFDVNEEGSVEHPTIVEVQGTVLSQDVTQRILDEVGYYQYEPLVIDDVPVRTNDVRHLIELRFHED